MTDVGTFDFLDPRGSAKAPLNPGTYRHPVVPRVDRGLKVSTDKLEPSAVAPDSNTLSVSTIGGDLTITGNVTSKGEINLDGHVQGDIHCVALVLGENSSVEGNVVADDVVIRGRLIGSVNALRVMLQSTSHVQGDLTYQSSRRLQQSNGWGADL